jgi:hypothetical protein
MPPAMRRLLYLIFLLFAPSAYAETFYVSQAGGVFSGGSACNGHTALSAAAFNTAGNWANPKVAGKIGPGDTVYACGTFTGTAGGTMLFFQGSGSSGSVITLLFDTGALFTAPYWFNGGAQAGGAINTNNKSFILIDGGPTCGWSSITETVTACNGIIQNTANGTSLANHSATIGIDVPALSNSIEIRNIWFKNLYVKTGTTSEVGQTDLNCVKMETSTPNGVTTAHIHHNICSDTGWGFVGGKDLIEWNNNEIYNIDHGIQSAPVTGWLHDNHFHDFAKWDAPAVNSAYHHDAFHCYGGGAGVGAANTLYLYNNRLDGDMGGGGQGFFYLEGAGSSTTCFISGAVGPYIFNNIAIANGGFQLVNGQIGNGAGAATLQSLNANNLLIGNQQSNNGMYGNQYNKVNHIKSVNNAYSGVGILQGQIGPVTYDLMDYNFYMNCITFGCFSADGVSSGSFATWQSSGHDTHGNAQLSSTTYFNLPAGCTVGSVAANCRPLGPPLVGAGTNLFSTCNGQPNPGLGALCNDITGAVRPTVGAWTVGPYNQSGGVIPPNPPTSLTGSVSGSTVNLSWTASSGTPVPTAYTLYRGTVHGGPYTAIKSGISALSTTDAPANGTYFYVVTAYVGGIVSSITANGVQGTVTCTATCSFPTGTVFTVGGNTQASFNSTFTSTGQPTGSTFTFSTAINATGTGGGVWTTSNESVKSNEIQATVPASLTVTLLPASRTFGSFTVGTSSPSQTAVLTNTSGAGNTVTISGKSISTGPNPGDFSFNDNCPSLLLSGLSCTFNITFTPTAAGARAANLTVVDNASGSPQSVALSGTGVSLTPGVSLNPTSLNFGDQTLSTTSTVRSIILTNTGSGTLTISSVVASGDFAVVTVPVTNCGGTLASLATCSLNVTFTPTATGGRTGAVTVTDNASGSPHVATLSGNGITTKCQITGLVTLSGVGTVCQ